MEHIQEHDIVYLKEDFEGRKKGEHGTVVHVYNNITAFEVEFSNPSCTKTIDKPILTKEKVKV